MRVNTPITNQDLRVTLKKLLESEIELNAIIADFSIHGHEKAHFNTLAYYHDSLHSIILVMKLIRMRLTLEGC